MAIELSIGIMNFTRINPAELRALEPLAPSRLWSVFELPQRPYARETAVFNFTQARKYILLDFVYLALPSRWGALEPRTYQIPYLVGRGPL